MNTPPTNNPLIPNMANNMLPGVVGPSSLPGTGPPGGSSVQAAAAAAAAINAMKQQLSAASQQQQGNNSNNLTANPNLNILGAGGGVNSAGGQGGANNQSQNLQHGYIQGSNQAANLLSPLEAHSHKISEYMR